MNRSLGDYRQLFIGEKIADLALYLVMKCYSEEKIVDLALYLAIKCYSEEKNADLALYYQK